MMHVVSFSGGKDSTAMLLMMIERQTRIDKIICIDTTKEFPEMYEHIENVQDYIYPREIEITKIDFDYWFSEHVKTRGKNKGKQGYGWPDYKNRWCTALKRDTILRKISGYDCIEYIGIAKDEESRMKKNQTGRKIEYPLIDWGIKERDALAYCKERGFDWGGLYDKFIRVSCYCCPFSRINELRVLYNQCLYLWRKLRKMDQKSYRQFRSDYSIAELEKRFENENRQLNLYKENE